MSAGTDSEAMAQTFLAAGVPFKAVSFDYGQGLNEYDYLGAVQFCRENGIRHDLISLDVTGLFYSGQLYKWYDKCQCTSFMFSVHLEFLSRIEGVPIMAWEPPHFKTDPFTCKVMLEFMEYPELSLLRYFQSAGKKAVPFFFLYSAEQYYSFLQTQVYRKLLAEGGAQSHYAVKTAAYREGGFKLSVNENGKKTGFENLIQQFDLLRSQGFSDARMNLQEYFESELSLRHGKISQIKKHIFRIEKF